MTKEKAHKYWSSDLKVANQPEGYLDNPNTSLRSKYLADKISQLSVEKTDKILEIGCNVGRNLNALYQDGFEQLVGIEINPHAIDLFEKSYPECYRTNMIYTNPIEDIFRKFEDDSIDLIFSMAVLMHIHPDSEFIFDEMMRVSKRYIITIEFETGAAGGKLDRIWQRYYKDIFEKNGWVETYSENVGTQCDTTMGRYTYRCFHLCEG